MRALIVLCLIVSAAHADAPKGFKCGPGGRPLKDACKCPVETMPSRDADNKAICAPKPEPKAETCLADRAGNTLVKIDSNPTSATLYLGSKDCGVVAKTPWSGKLQPGPLAIVVEQNGYDPSTRTITVAPKTTTELYIPLVRIEIGSVEVRADADPNVAGAPIKVDGQAQGTVPGTVKLRAGRHLVEIAKPGFDAFSQWVTVEEAKTVALLPTLHAVTVAKARLVIDADVPQAEVFVDGVRRGTTPVAIDDLPLGVHKVSVRKPPAKNWDQSITLAAGSTLLRAELAATLPKSPTDGTLEIASDVPDASVMIDGVDAGKTPLTRALPAGDHWIVVSLPGHMKYEQRVALEAGKQLKLAAKLVPAGELKVASTPAGSTVFIDGVRQGVTPLAIQLPLGDHIVIVERAGYQRFQKTVKLTDKGAELSTVLKP